MYLFFTHKTKLTIIITTNVIITVYIEPFRSKIQAENIVISFIQKQQDIDLGNMDMHQFSFWASK